MERLYKALAWLAAVALGLGLVIAYLFLTTAINRYPQGLTFGSSDGLVGAFFKALSFQTANMAMSLSNLLGSGAIVLAAVLAWANRRPGWLTALIVAALLTLIWPPFILASQNLALQPGQMEIPGIQLEIFNFLMLSVLLIPVALALAFALIRRQPAAAEIDAMESDAMESDATLEIIRSPL